MLSIIIPAHNEEKFLGKTLRTIVTQNYKDYEVIVVCNGCTDKTQDIAKWFKATVINSDYKNVSKARNDGAKIAKGNRLVFLDADTKLIEKDALKKIEETKASIGITKGIPDNDKKIAHNFVKLKNNLWWTKWSNGLIFCDKEVFEKSGGFNEEKTKSEISDFFKKAKGKFGCADTKVLISMRRFENKGYYQTAMYWIKQSLFPTKEEYETIR